MGAVPKNVLLLPVVIVVSIVLLAGCDPRTTSGTLTPLNSEQLRVKIMIEETYEYITDMNWQQVWENYSTAWRERCSYDAMVDAFQRLESDGVANLEPVDFREITLETSRADARYTIVAKDENGVEQWRRPYRIALVKEENQWLAEESCY